LEVGGKTVDRDQLESTIINGKRPCVAIRARAPVETLMRQSKHWCVSRNTDASVETLAERRANCHGKTNAAATSCRVTNRRLCASSSAELGHNTELDLRRQQSKVNMF
jgi:hypothetical protein